MQRRILRRSAVLLALILLPASSSAQSWCAQTPRAGYEGLERVPVRDDWFKVYRVDPGVFAIYEPYNFQEIISYLIVGGREALLFDTGMGMGRISAVVRALTPLPVTVLNSHTHFDHTGGNAEFASILGLETDFTRQQAKGSTHAQVADEVTPAAFCQAHLTTPFDTATYRIRPFAISKTVREGTVIDLGGRRVEILHIPGHAPDAIALLDRDNGLVWTGDTFYEGPLWPFSSGTDVEAYARSLERLAALAPTLRKVLPAHNTPVTSPPRLAQVRDALARVRSGSVEPTTVRDGVGEYRIDGFTFLIRTAQR